MKRKITFILFILLSNILFSQTTLAPGDIAIIQYNARGNPEIIKFIALTKIESGTEINFTDKGWITTGTPQFRTNEGVHTWVASSDVLCGDIVTVATTNTIGSFGLSVDGDQILVYQGTLASPVFIFAINNDGNGVWQSSATSAQTSALLPGLTNTVNAVAIQEVNNVLYSGSLVGNKATILSNICDKSNWNSGNTATSNNTNNSTSALNFTDTFTSTFSAGSWSIAGGEYVATIIDDDFDTSSDNDFETCSCTVNSGNTLTVNSGGTVTVDEDIKNNGTIIVESGGSVVQVTSDGMNSGTDYTVKRETSSQSSAHVFTYWSSPITSATFAAVATSAHLLYSFDAGSQSYILGSPATAMNPGIGYSLEGPSYGTYPGPQLATFTGAPFNNGDIPVALGFTSDGNADNDWNLVGNPYPSAIDADTFLDDNAANIGGTIYFWTHNTPEDGTEANTEDDYAMYNSVGGVGAGSAAATGGAVPDGNIASAQGFFVQALSSSLNFTNSMRIAGNNTSFFRSSTTKKQKEETTDRIWLNINNEKSFSQILIGFLEDATDNEDNKYDGIRFSGKSSLNLYSILNDKHFGIQGKSPLKESEIIPLGFSSDTFGDFTISIDKVEGKIENTTVYIVDKNLDIAHDLKYSDYVFSTFEDGEFNDRFSLVLIAEGGSLNVDDNSELVNNIQIQNQENRLVLKTLNNNVIINVAIYNLLGEEIFKAENDTSNIIIDSKNLKSNSIFIVKTMLENGKLLVNKVYKN